MATTKPTIVINTQKLIEEVAVQHSLILKPDDAAFALVTMNRLVLEQSLESVLTVMKANLSAWGESCRQVRSDAREAITVEVKSAGEQIRKTIARDLEDAKIQTTSLVQRATQLALNWAEIKTSLVLAAVSVLLGCAIGFEAAYFNYVNKEKPNVPERVVTQPAPQPTENPHPHGGRRGAPVLKGAPK